MRCATTEGLVDLRPKESTSPTSFHHPHCRLRVNRIKNTSPLYILILTLATCGERLSVSVINACAKPRRTKLQYCGTSATGAIAVIMPATALTVQDNETGQDHDVVESYNNPFATWPRPHSVIGSLVSVGALAVIGAANAASSSPAATTLALYITIASAQSALLIHELHAIVKTRRRRLRSDKTSISVLIIAVIITILVAVLYGLSMLGPQPAAASGATTSSFT